MAGRNLKKLLQERSEHLHVYKRVNLAKRGNPPYYVFKCTLPGCTHYSQRQLIIGKTSQCPECEQPFELTSENTTNARPLCEACRPRKKGKDVSATTQSVVDNLLSSLLGKKKSGEPGVS